MFILSALTSQPYTKNRIHPPGHSLIFQLRFKTDWGNTNCPASKIYPANQRQPSTSTESSIFPLQQLGTQSGKVFLYHPKHHIMKRWGNHLVWIESKFSMGENIVRSKWRCISRTMQILTEVWARQLHPTVNDVWCCVQGASSSAPDCTELRDCC